MTNETPLMLRAIPVVFNTVKPVSRKTLMGSSALVSIRRAMSAVVIGIGLVVAKPALANPEGGKVVEGSATIVQESATKLGVHQTTGKAIIDWQSFNIGANEHTQFYQPSSSSITLNRVTGGDPSEILGRLSANGRIMIINPNGVLFGRNSRIDVAALVASTHDIKNQDFMADRFNFTQPGNPAATITNLGNISVADKGVVAFVAPGVRNDGVIAARLGKVALASANGFTLDLYGDQLISLMVDDKVAEKAIDKDGNPVDALVDNKGTISADGGYVLLTANAARDVIDNVINNSGIVEAKSAGMVNGEIVLSGGDAGVVNVSGTLDASGKDAGQTGGKVQITGEKVGLFAGANVDVSGDAGGGTALVGGDFQGEGEVPTAQFAYVHKDAVIDADALTEGDGGKAIIWSEQATRSYGKIIARGGSVSGDGGLIETSGREFLEVSGAPDASAANGKAGEWLLDPSNVTISAAATSNGSFDSGDPNTFSTSADDAVVQASDIVASLEAGTDVKIKTSGSGGSQDGNITITSDIVANPGAEVTLKLLAHNDITLNGGVNLQSTGSKLNLTLLAGNTHSGFANWGANWTFQSMTANVNLQGGLFTTVRGSTWWQSSSSSSSTVSTETQATIDQTTTEVETYEPVVATPPEPIESKFESSKSFIEGMFEGGAERSAPASPSQSTVVANEPSNNVATSNRELSLEEQMLVDFGFSRENILSSSPEEVASAISQMKNAVGKWSFEQRKKDAVKKRETVAKAKIQEAEQQLAEANAKEERQAKQQEREERQAPETPIETVISTDTDIAAFFASYENELIDQISALRSNPSSDKAEIQRLENQKIQIASLRDEAISELRHQGKAFSPSQAMVELFRGGEERKIQAMFQPRMAELQAEKELYSSISNNHPKLAEIDAELTQLIGAEQKAYDDVRRNGQAFNQQEAHSILQLASEDREISSFFDPQLDAARAKLDQLRNLGQGNTVEYRNEEANLNWLLQGRERAVQAVHHEGANFSENNNFLPPKPIPAKGEVASNAPTNSTVSETPKAQDSGQTESQEQSAIIQEGGSAVQETSFVVAGIDLTGKTDLSPKDKIALRRNWDQLAMTDKLAVLKQFPELRQLAAFNPGAQETPSSNTSEQGAAIPQSPEAVAEQSETSEQQPPRRNPNDGARPAISYEPVGDDGIVIQTNPDGSKVVIAPDGRQFDVGEGSDAQVIAQNVQIMINNQKLAEKAKKEQTEQVALEGPKLEDGSFVSEGEEGNKPDGNSNSPVPNSDSVISADQIIDVAMLAGETISKLDRPKIEMLNEILNNKVKISETVMGVYGEQLEKLSSAAKATALSMAQSVSVNLSEKISEFVQQTQSDAIEGDHVDQVGSHKISVNKFIVAVKDISDSNLLDGPQTLKELAAITDVAANAAQGKAVGTISSAIEAFEKLNETDPLIATQNALIQHMVDSGQITAANIDDFYDMEVYSPYKKKLVGFGDPVTVRFIDVYAGLVSTLRNGN